MASRLILFQNNNFISTSPLCLFCLSLSPWGDMLGLCTWCQVRSVIPTWFSELSTGTVLLSAAWSITLCLSLIHSTFQKLYAWVCVPEWAQRNGRLKLAGKEKSETVFRNIYIWAWHKGWLAEKQKAWWMFVCVCVCVWPTAWPLVTM